MKILESKSIKTVMETSLEGLNRRFEQADKTTNRLIEIIQSEEQKEWRIINRVSETCGTPSSIHIRGVQERKKREEKKRIFEETMAKNFLSDEKQSAHQGSSMNSK